MASKFNSEFNYRYQVIGHTPWEKIKTLQGFLEGRVRAAVLEEVGALKDKAKIAKLKRLESEGGLEEDILTLKAELLEAKSFIATEKEAFELNNKEIEILNKLLEELYVIAEPTRIPGYSDEEMWEANQANEFTVNIGKEIQAEMIEEDKRGYKAIQLGFGNIKSSKLTKAMKGLYAKKNTEAKKKLKEFRVKDTEIYKEGNEFGLEIFNEVKFVDTTSRTIGKGFAGAMKRHNFGGLRATHGVSVSHRSHGSTGQRQDPGKVFKGKKMAGHMGDRVRTMQNLEIIKTDLENELLYVKGSIPGSKNSEILVKQSVKVINKMTIKEKIAAAEEAKKIPDKKKR